MRLDWVLFSANDHSAFGGHRWRAGSRRVEDCPAELSSYAELPPYAESQTGWQPYHTGLSAGSEIALSYIVPNRTAGRSNRLTTYVLFVPTDAPSLWEALWALQNPALFKASDPIDIPDNTQHTSASSNAAVLEVEQILQVFATTRNKQVVLQSVDEPRFLDALWQALWPSARRALTFRRHFHPREISSVLPNPQLIMVPDGTAWAREPGYQVIRPQGNGMPPNPITVGPEFEGTLTQLRPYVNLIGGLKRSSEADLSELQHLWGLLTNVPLTGVFENQQELKISTAIAACIPDAKPKEILTLQGIVDMQGTLTSAVTTWMQGHLTAGRALPDEMWVQRIVDAHDWMLIGLQEGLRSQGPSEAAAKLLWPWLSFKAGQELLSVLNSTWEQVFTQSLPTRSTPAVAAWAAKKGWWILHGLLEIQRNLTDGLEVVFDKTPTQQVQAVLGAVRSVTTDRDLLRALEQLGSDAAQSLASDIVIDNATLRAMIRAESDWWRQVWTQALPGLRNPFDGLPDPEQLQRILIDEHAAHGQVPEELLIAVAQSGVHLLNRPDRAALWSKVPAAFLANTAAAYVTAHTSPGPPDAVLLRAIHTSGLLINSDEAAQDLAGHLTDLTDEQARNVLHRLRLPAREHVKGAYGPSYGLFEHLYATMSDRIPDWLVPGLPDEMKLERAARRGETLPDDIWWALAFRIIPDRVEEGPYRFWTAAGGKSGALEENGTTRTKWAAALSTSRSTGKPPIVLLLNEILHSYAADQVQQLKQTKRQ